MNKIKMRKVNDLTVNEAFEKYVISKRALGVKDITVQTYHYHFSAVSSLLCGIIRSKMMITKSKGNQFN